MKSIFATGSALTLALLVAACGSDGANGADGAAGAAGAAGAKGDTGKAGDSSQVTPTVNFVTPNRAVLDREIDVTISGSATKFAAGAKLDFGAGITVSDVRALSATAIAAKLKIAPTATLGLHDVTVDGVKVPGAFAVIPAVSAAPVVGKLNQGAFAQIAFQNNDTNNPFDKDLFKFNSTDFADLGVAADSNLFGGGFVVVGPLSATAPQVSLANVDAEGKARTTFLADPDDVKVTARTATALTANPATAVTATLGASLDSYFGKLPIAAGQAVIVDYRVQATAASATTPLAAIFGKGGKAKDFLGLLQPGQGAAAPYDLHFVLPTPSVTAAEDQFIVLTNGTGKAGSATIAPAVIRAEQIAEQATAHATGATAQDLTTLQAIPANLATDIGGKVVVASTADENETDVYKVTVAAGDQIEIAIGGAGSASIYALKAAALTNANVLTSAESPAPGQAANARFTVPAGVTTLFFAVFANEGGAGGYTFSVRKVAAP
jgi:hypothetical protein